MKIYSAILIIVFVVACSDKPTQEEYNKLKNELADNKVELENAKQTIQDLENTPEKRLHRGIEYQLEEKYDEAIIEYSTLCEKFPNSKEFTDAQNRIDEINKIIEKQKLLEERKRTLGFKAIKEISRVKIGPTEIKFKNIKSKNKFIHDWYGDTYHYRTAERGEIYVTCSVNITSDTKNPKLPPIYIYEIVEGELRYIYKMDYEFHRWKDYGTFLGNYHDNGNDFTYSKSINFDVGLSISKDKFKSNPIFVIVGNQNCVTRENKEYGRPEVAYRNYSCPSKSILNINDFDEDYYLVKVFNKNKL